MVRPVDVDDRIRKRQTEVPPGERKIIRYTVGEAQISSSSSWMVI